MSRPIIMALLALAFIAGCARSPRHPDSEEMYVKASALTKLSAAVESTVRYKNPPQDLSEDELLKLATRHDPVLLENFKGYQVRVRREDSHAVVLVCDATRTRALLEDAGCTGPMDRNRWMGNPQPCEFSIRPEEACK